MTTLADIAILSGADNRPPMLEKDMYDSWKSRMELYMMNRQHHGSHALSSTPLSITYPSNDFQSSVQHNVYNPSSYLPQVEYAPSVLQQSDFSQQDSSLIGPVFQKGKQRIVVCYNYKGKGHMSKQCTKPERKRDEAWFKDKVALMAMVSIILLRVRAPILQAVRTHCALLALPRYNRIESKHLYTSWVPQ
nr:hypothetical protein [Tanacetum cinerariifolium]